MFKFLYGSVLVLCGYKDSSAAKWHVAKHGSIKSGKYCVSTDPFICTLIGIKVTEGFISAFFFIYLSCSWSVKPAGIKTNTIFSFYSLIFVSVSAKHINNL